jgi:hypothetical protein
MADSSSAFRCQLEYNLLREALFDLSAMTCHLHLSLEPLRPDVVTFLSSLRMMAWPVTVLNTASSAPIPVPVFRWVFDG